MDQLMIDYIKMTKNMDKKPIYINIDQNIHENDIMVSNQYKVYALTQKESLNFNNNL